MHVLLIYPDICVASGRFYQGLGYIASVLKKAGHTVSLLHIEKEPTKDELLSQIEKLNPDIIGFSSTTNQYNYVELFSGWVQERFSIPIVCGGIHPTMCPEGVISNENIDIVCIGEGEYPMLELADRLERKQDITDIRNMWVKKEGKVYKNPLRLLIENLDELPLADREVFNYEKLLEKYAKIDGIRIAEIMTGRGCPFNCTYCCNHALRRIYKDLGVYVRRRNVDNVLAEIKYLKEKYNVDFIVFDDDTFTLQPEWLREFCDKYSQEFDIPFQCNAYPTTVDEEKVSLLKKAGCVRIAIGVESGNENIRRNVLNRQMSNEQIIKAFEIVNKSGIKAYSFNMIGLPYDTVETIEDTLDINRKLNPDHMQVSVFYPYPGTELYELCKNKGWLSESKKSSYFGDESVLNLSSITKNQIKKYYRMAYLQHTGKTIESRYPKLYSLYKIANTLLGTTITYHMAIAMRKILYHY